MILHVVTNPQGYGGQWEILRPAGRFYGMEPTLRQAKAVLGVDTAHRGVHPDYTDTFPMEHGVNGYSVYWVEVGDKAPAVGPSEPDQPEEPANTVLRFRPLYPPVDGMPKESQYMAGQTCEVLGLEVENDIDDWVLFWIRLEDGTETMVYADELVEEAE